VTIWRSEPKSSASSRLSGRLVY